MSPECPTRLEGDGDGAKYVRPAHRNAIPYPHHTGRYADVPQGRPSRRARRQLPPHAKQATIDSTFIRRKHYFLSMQNIKLACFTALDSSVNDAFKLSNLAGVRGWHAGMTTVTILDQLSSVYGKPTCAVLEANDTLFRSPYSAADAPEVLFQRIEDCAEIAMLRDNPYTDKQLILMAVCHILTTGLYIRAFKDWDLLDPADRTWVSNAL